MSGSCRATKDPVHSSRVLVLKQYCLQVKAERENVQSLGYRGGCHSGKFGQVPVLVLCRSIAS